MNSNSNINFKKGIFFGILVGIAWGLDGTLIGHIGLNPIFRDFTFAKSFGIGLKTFEFSPLVTAFFHESFCFFWVSAYLLFRKQLKHVFYLLFKTKKGRAAAIAAIIGSPFGMSAYLLGIKYASAPYASSISVIYPGVGAIISYFVLKERLSKKSILGISISLFGSFMLGFNPSANVPETFLKGIFFASLAVLGWALEGVIIAFAMKKITDEEDIEASPQQFLCLRYFMSMVIYSLVILPAINGYPLAKYIVLNGIAVKYLFVAVLGAFTYLLWYKAVDLIGAAMGTALNSTAALWTIIFSTILFRAPLSSSLILWGTVIVLGVFIFAISPLITAKKNKNFENGGIEYD